MCNPNENMKGTAAMRDWLRLIHSDYWNIASLTKIVQEQPHIQGVRAHRRKVISRGVPSPKNTGISKKRVAPLNRLKTRQKFQWKKKLPRNQINRYKGSVSDLEKKSNKYRIKPDKSTSGSSKWLLNYRN